MEERVVTGLDTTPYFDKDESIAIHGDRLPHWNQRGKYVFFTFRLADSLPKYVRDALQIELDYWDQSHPKPWDSKTELERNNICNRRIEDLCDNGYGSCVLRNPDVLRTVKDVMHHDDGVKYELIDYVIMPNHVHALLKLIEGTTVESVMGEWKSVSSHKLKKQLGNEWCGWMAKYHDRLIRNDRHFTSVLAYIHKNRSHGGLFRYRHGQ